ncbi:MAG: outer membrane lipoprotein-sorting protein [Acidobacteriota bacterium]|nr:outer membrane lipoprotein-sorting protein [Blastocatellia bacterium]MDW8238750.1 outer membrane lipoprotein-sorting protein [Acidobacteriota bacterium]
MLNTLPRCVVVLLLVAVGQACQREQTASTPETPPLPTGEQIVQQYLNRDRCRDAKTKIKARVKEADGTEREFIIMNYQKCVDDTQYTIRQQLASKGDPARVLLTIQAPGQPIQSVTYLPGMAKFVEVQDLRQEDSQFGMTLQESVGGYDLYEYRLIGMEQIGPLQTYKVEGQLKPDATSRFYKMVIYFRQDNYLPARIELYNAENQLVRLRSTLWMQQNGRWRDVRTEVDNRKYQKRIVFETMEADDNPNIPLSFFTRENLKKLVEASLY